MVTDGDGNHEKWLVSGKWSWLKKFARFFGEQAAKALPFFTIKGIGFAIFCHLKDVFVLQIIEPNQTFFSVKIVIYSDFKEWTKTCVHPRTAHHYQILKSSVKYDWTLCFYSDLWLYRKELQRIYPDTVLSIENDIASQKRVFE